MTADPVILTLLEALDEAPPRPTVLWGRGLQAVGRALAPTVPTRAVLGDIRDVPGHVVPTELALLPAPGAEDRYVCRLPRSREELVWMATVAAARLGAGGELWVFGHHQEGIRSTAKALGPIFGRADTVWGKRRCRVVVARRQDGSPQAPPDLDSFARSFEVPAPAGPPLRCCSLPGVFSHGRLDGGTARLARALSGLAAPRRALDLGCGVGVLGLTLWRAHAEARVDLIDVSVAAVEASRRSAEASGAGRDPRLRIHLAAAEDAPAGPYDLIVTNPPFHDGRQQERHHLAALAAAAARRLTPAGTFLAVANRHLGYRDDLLAAFAAVDVLDEDTRFRIWRAREPR